VEISGPTLLASGDVEHAQRGFFAAGRRHPRATSLPSGDGVK
jgi:hypothetical protein